MVQFLRELLFGRKAATRDGAAGRGSRELRLAAAALLVEAAKLDGDFDEVERARIIELLRERFDMTADDAGVLTDAADEKTDLASGLYRFTKEIRDNFDHDERVSVIEMLWEVAYADGVLHDFEANMLRRAAGLLYVTDRESGEARKRVLGRLSSGGEGA